MEKYGLVALKAIELIRSGQVFSPVVSWEEASCEILGEGTSGQKKGCPKNAFLGLCEDGLVKGVVPGKYTRSKKNKSYAITAVNLLKISPELSSSSEILWSRVMSQLEKNIIHNEQMDVVLTLWKSGLIEG